jgi:DNA (cytosine-5)-methyltransferase 1
MTAYYNEFDPKAAAWLRELIKRGLIADGVVDERSILDVVAADLVGFTQCHFFAGIGGWSCALRLAGWQDDWPVWTGSPPCQPFSAAGQQKGQADDRHLAPHFAALVAAGRPPILFGEQVASSPVLGKAAKRAGGGAGEPPEWAWIDDLSDRLEAAHYAVGAADIPAAGVGAPHIRQRTFFGAIRLADTGGEGSQGRGGADRSELGQDRHPAARSAAGGVADADEGERGRVADGEGRQHDWEAGGRQQGDREPERGGSGVGMADAGCSQRKTDGLSGRVQSQDNSTWWDIPNGGLVGCKQGYRDTCRQSTERTRSLDCFWQDADWLFCRDGKWRPVEPGTFPLAHGIPARVVRLRGYGNAIVPQAAAQFVKAFVAAANY